MATATSAIASQRMPVSEALIGLELRDQEKTAISDYLKKYSIPTTCKDYPSWMLFRVTEFVLNLLGNCSKRIKSKGQEIKDAIQLRFTNLVKDNPEFKNEGIYYTTQQLDNGQIRMTVSLNETAVRAGMQAVIPQRAEQLARHLLKQLCSSAKINPENQEVRVMKTKSDFTYSNFIDVLLNDKESFRATRSVSICQSDCPY